MPTCIVLFCFLTMLVVNTARAQTPTDDIMMPSGQVCAAVMYSHATFDQYWQGTTLLSNGNMGTLTTQTISPMAAIGIFSWLNAYVGINYVSAQPSAGTLAGDYGWQDAGVWLKYEPLNRAFGPGTIHGLATLGFTGPVGNYVPEYPYSIGLGCTNTSAGGILEYEHESGIYLRGEGAYNERGITTISEDYYYTTQQYYSNQVVIPEAVNYAVTAGYRIPSGEWYAEGFYQGLHTNGGFDIRPWETPFPSNQMNFTLLGADGHYYPTYLKGIGTLGIVLEGSYVLTGRNVGQTANLAAGVTYQFGVWGNGSNTIRDSQILFK